MVGVATAATAKAANLLQLVDLFGEVVLNLGNRALLRVGLIQQGGRFALLEVFQHFLFLRGFLLPQGNPFLGKGVALVQGGIHGPQEISLQNFFRQTHKERTPGHHRVDELLPTGADEINCGQQAVEGIRKADFHPLAEYLQFHVGFRQAHNHVALNHAAGFVRPLGHFFQALRPIRQHVHQGRPFRIKSFEGVPQSLVFGQSGNRVGKLFHGLFNRKAHRVDAEFGQGAFQFALAGLRLLQSAPKALNAHRCRAFVDRVLPPAKLQFLQEIRSDANRSGVACEFTDIGQRLSPGSQAEEPRPRGHHPAQPATNRAAQSALFRLRVRPLNLRDVPINFLVGQAQRLHPMIHRRTLQSAAFAFLQLALGIRQPLLVTLAFLLQSGEPLLGRQCLFRRPPFFKVDLGQSPTRFRRRRTCLTRAAHLVDARDGLFNPGNPDLDFVFAASHYCCSASAATLSAQAMNSRSSSLSISIRPCFSQ